MEYRTLGKTGLQVSRLGFGAMRLPMKGGRVDEEATCRLIRLALESGVNYFDTAVFYCNEGSEGAVGKGLKGWKGDLVVSTKNHYKAGSGKEWRKMLDQSEFFKIGRESLSRRFRRKASITKGLNTPVIIIALLPCPDKFRVPVTHLSQIFLKNCHGEDSPPKAANPLRIKARRIQVLRHPVKGKRMRSRPMNQNMLGIERTGPKMGAPLPSCWRRCGWTLLRRVSFGQDLVPRPASRCMDPECLPTNT